MLYYSVSIYLGYIIKTENVKVNPKVTAEKKIPLRRLSELAK